MKTRRRNSKGGRKSLIAKKSPTISRKNARAKKNPDNTFSKLALAVYESPLDHFRYKGTSFVSDNKPLAKYTRLSNLNQKQNTKCSDTETEPKCSTYLSPVKSETLSTTTNAQIKSNEETPKENNQIVLPNNAFKRKHTVFGDHCAENSPNIKKQKRKKNPLSRPSLFNETSNVAVNTRESIIVIEDELLPNKLPSNKSVPSKLPPNLSADPDDKQEEVIIIDCDESFQDTNFLQKTFDTKSETDDVQSESVIVLDDEETSPSKMCNDKPTEDCSVVWSSASTSNAPDDTTLEQPPRIGSVLNLALLKQNKILLDTRADSNISRKIISSKIKGKCKNVKPILTKGVPKMKKTTSKKTRNSDLIHLSENQNEDQLKFKKGSLREIIIDGNNCALAYTNNKCFSEKGIELLISYFTKRGHKIKVFIPQYRRARRFPLLEKWYEDGIVVFTPSRKIGNKSYTPYDDRYIITYASACQGIVVSQDQFRDLYYENNSFKITIEKRLLIPTFVGDYVMFPKDPLGRDGPTLENFLKH